MILPAPAHRPFAAGTPVAVTGMGCIGAPGEQLEDQCRALTTGWCGLQASHLPGLPLAARLPVARVAAPLPPIPGRTAALALAAARAALSQARLEPHERGEVAVVVGTCTAGLPESEADYLSLGPEATSPAYRRQQAHRTTQAVARLLRLGGAQSTHSVACASAAAALVEAIELVRSGIAPIVVAIGADALTRITMAGFASLQLVDALGCTPLIDERRGMSLGEGAAALVIEDPAHARARGVPVQGTLMGWGMRADGFHATTPDPTARELTTAIRDALRDGRCRPEDVDYVCAHGTGTRDNDACEIRALSDCFGAVPTASWKRTYGHTMGACAAIEAVGAILALQAQRHFPSAGADLGTPLAGVDVVRQARTARLRTVVSTTLAFGGVNAALLIGGAERCA